MAAFGDICLENTKEARKQLISIIPPKILPDEILTLDSLHPLLHPFLLDLNKILTVQDVATRDIAREALGVELHPRLCPRALKYLDETTRAYEREELNEEYLLFLEQVQYRCLFLFFSSAECRGLQVYRYSEADSGK